MRARPFPPELPFDGTCRLQTQFNGRDMTSNTGAFCLYLNGRPDYPGSGNTDVYITLVRKTTGQHFTRVRFPLEQGWNRYCWVGRGTVATYYWSYEVLHINWVSGEVQARKS